MRFLKDINQKDSHKRLISIISFSMACVLILATYVLSYIYLEFPTPKFSYYAIYSLLGVSGFTTTATLMERKK
jgi:predicted membrane channel-forming protein YqfA (hemolysin III family)